MFIKLWNYLRGYVIVIVTGFSVERFLNLTVHKDIFVWDIYRKENGIEMKVSIKAFKQLRPFARKTGCRLKITKKCGFPFVLNRYRKRKVLMIGILFFVSCLFYLSSFVWLIEIHGTERIVDNDIVRFLENNGFSIGKSKYSINTKEVEKLLLANFSDISWISIQLSGTKADINIKESIEKQAMIDRNTPCNVIAKKDGVIISVATSAGTPSIKSGDVVRKGDLLVASELSITNNDDSVTKTYVHAMSEIKAKTYFEIFIDIPLFYIEKNYTGNITNDYSIMLLDKTYNFIKYHTSYENYDKNNINSQLSFGAKYPLPFVIRKEEYTEFLPLQKERTIDEAKQYGEVLLNSRLIREFNISTNIIDKDISYQRIGNALRLTALITVIERIDEQQVIEIEPIDN